MINSFIISAYKHNQLVVECLKSLRKYHPTSEVIICDDGSEKTTQEELKHIAKEFKCELLLSFWNCGFSFNNNKAIYRAKGDIITLVNDDIIFTENIEQEMFSKFQADPQLGIMGYLLYYPDMKIQHGGHVRFKNSTTMRHNDHGFNILDANKAFNSWYIIGVTGALMSLRKSMIDEIGAFRSGYGLAYEDVELCLRAWHTGYRIWYTSKVSAIHAEGKTRGTTPQSKHNLGTMEKEIISSQQYANDVKTFDFYLIDRKISVLNSGIDGTMEGNILFKRKNALGDCLMATGIIKHFKDRNPLANVYIETHYPEIFRGICKIYNFNTDYNVKFGMVYDLNLCYEKQPKKHRLLSYGDYVFGEDKYIISDIIPKIPEMKMDIVLSFEDEKFVVINPSESWASRTISEKVWDEVIQGLKRKGYSVCILGKDTKVQAGNIKGVYAFFEELSIEACRKIISKAEYFIGPDSGLLHVAQLTKTKAIGIFSVADPKTVVWREENTFVIEPKTECKYCLSYKIKAPCTNMECEKGTNECIKSISSDMILNLIKERG